MSRKQRSPGPAAYNVSSSIGKSPAYSFGTQIRPSPSANASESPGPTVALKQSVGRQRDITYPGSPSFGFGSAQRLSLGKSAGTPGPGEYKLVSNAGKSSLTRKEIPALSFGTAPRLPGDAPVQRRMDKTTLEKLQQTSSQLKHVLNSQSTDVTVVRDPLLEQTPGPGAYDGDFKRKTVPAYSFGSSSQRPKPSRKSLKIPGPGQYPAGTTLGNKTVLTHKRASSITFGTSRDGIKVSSMTETPGPGTYQQPSAFGSQPGRVRTLPQYTFGTTPRETMTE